MLKLFAKINKVLDFEVEHLLKKTSRAKKKWS